MAFPRSLGRGHSSRLEATTAGGLNETPAGRIDRGAANPGAVSRGEVDPGAVDPGAAAAYLKARHRLFAEASLGGIALCEALAGATDTWVRQLFEVATSGEPRGVALLAVGGYGRRMLAPGSDVDLVLIHDSKREMSAVAPAIWYPIWDAGIRLDHSVRTLREVRAATEGDLKVALGLLEARRVAGDESLAAESLRLVRRTWEARAKRWLPQVHEMVRKRHRDYGDLAFLLEPDLKEARGGLRDANLLPCVAQIVHVLDELVGPGTLDGPQATLTRVRVELQRHAKRSTERLTLEDQDQVASRCGFADADALMSDLASAARAVAWTSDDGWRRVLSSLAGPGGRAGGYDRQVEAGLVLRDGEVALATSADPGSDPSLALRAASLSAEIGLPLSRRALDRLAESTASPARPWPPEVLVAFLRLLAAGPGTIQAVEALDQVGTWARYLPEWGAVRNRPQRNAYHRFTVDRHLVETAVNAAQLVRRVTRPDLLLAAALLHDIGKSVPGDHVTEGARMAHDLALAMGFDASDSAVLRRIVELHLLLPDVATRRDLDDPATAAAVARAVGSREVLDLLGALTEADSIATGPSAWSEWKASLITSLVERAGALLEGRPHPRTGIDIEQADRALLEAGTVSLRAEGTRLSVVAPDGPGKLATITGVLALWGLNIRSATTWSDESRGMALYRFELAPPSATPDWHRWHADLTAALDGRLRVDDRLSRQERPLLRRRRAAAADPVVRVTTDNQASEAASVVEVRAPDSGPVLYYIARALNESGLTILSAWVSTLGHEVVDSLYVRTTDGGKLVDPELASEIETAVYRALGTASRTSPVSESPSRASAREPSAPGSAPEA